MTEDSAIEQARAAYFEGDALARQGRLVESLTYFRKAFTYEPAFRRARMAMVSALLILGQQSGRSSFLQEARNQCLIVLRDEPENSSVWLQLGKSCKMMEDYDAAAEALLKAVALNPECAESHCWLGNTYDQIGAFDEAIEHYRLSVKYNPHFFDAWAAMAVVAEKIQDKKSAWFAVDNGLEVAPDFPQLLQVKAKLLRQEKRYEEVLQVLEHLLRLEFIPVASQLVAWEQKGKALDALGRYSEAFDAFVTMHAIAATTPEAQSQSTADLDALIDSYRQWLGSLPSLTDAVSVTQAVAYDDVASPIFLVGFPRSGTTLTEQILHSHSEINSTEERQVLVELVKEMIVEYGRGAFPSILDTLDGEAIGRWRRRYWEIYELECDPLPKGQRLLDKLPLNIMHLGLIYRLFPQAPIITVLRDPRDVILSGFMQSFEPNPAMLQFASLEKGSEFYHRIMELYGLAESRMPLNQLRLRYEDLVADTESVARSLLGFLQLEWQDSVLEYYHEKHSRYVATPSYEGVVQPVYRSSIGRWKHYSDEFAGAAQWLQAYVDAFGYADVRVD